MSGNRYLLDTNAVDFGMKNCALRRGGQLQKDLSIHMETFG